MRVAIVGGGAWGTALARLAVGRGHATRLWAREPELVEAIRSRRENPLFLPGVALPEALEATSDCTEAVRGAELVVLAVPSQHLASVLGVVADAVPGDALVVSATKGLEARTYRRMSEVIVETLGRGVRGRLAVLSGPTFAKEVAEDQPTAAVVASARATTAERVQRALATPRLRLYTNTDVVGVELGGALKNVIAIAAGVCAGLGLGHNPVAALLTRGLAEISRLSRALGGRRRTLAGLAGLGDLVLTCTGTLSRNRSVGVELGKGRPLAEILASMRSVAEGVPTTRAAVALARRHRVEMPITFQMEKLLRGETTPAEAIERLMRRPLVAE